MLTSFFGKSSPINYILLCSAMVLGSLYSIFLNQEPFFSVETLPFHLGITFLMVFSVLLLDFIIRKNNVTETNTFTIFLFVLFTLMVPEVFTSFTTVLANVFLLLATRRILSLSTEKNIEKKIFDATMYITLASFCYGWSVLYFSILFISILYKTNVSIRYVFIPFIGFLGITSLAISYQLLVTDSMDWIWQWVPAIDLDFNAYNQVHLLLPATLFITLFLWSGTTRILQRSSLSKKEKPSAMTMLITTVVAIGMVVCSPLKNGSELVYVFAPLAAITGNYIENKSTKERRIFNEVLLWFFVILILIIAFV